MNEEVGEAVVEEDIVDISFKERTRLKRFLGEAEVVLKWVLVCPSQITIVAPNFRTVARLRHPFHSASHLTDQDFDRTVRAMIRFSTPDDWDALVDVYDHSKPDELQAAGLDVAFISLRNDETAIELLKEVQVLVYENAEGRVVGFGGYNADYIGWLFVHRDARKQGVGRALLREMIRYCSGKPWLWLLPGNQPAFALYMREGFRLQDGARIKIHGIETTALKMVRA